MHDPNSPNNVRKHYRNTQHVRNTQTWFASPGASCGIDAHDPPDWLFASTLPNAKLHSLFLQASVQIVQAPLTIRVGQNRIYTPYMTVCMVISLPKTPYIHRMYL